MRTFEQIIASEKTPTVKERAFAQGLLDKWYGMQCIINVERPTVEGIRQQYSYLHHMAKYSDGIDLTAVLRQLSELAGRVATQLQEPYIYAETIE